jgi:hypothetical protein
VLQLQNQERGILDWPYGIPSQRGDFLEIQEDGMRLPTKINFNGLGNNAVQLVSIEGTLSVSVFTSLARAL